MNEKLNRKRFSRVMIEKSQFTYWQFGLTIEQIKRKHSGRCRVWIKNEHGHNHWIKDTIKNSFQQTESRITREKEKLFRKFKKRLFEP